MTRPPSCDHRLIVDMLEDGYTIDGVMRELGCNRSAITYARRKFSSSIKFPPGPTAVDDELIERLFRQGWTRQAIADELGVCFRTVERSRARINQARR